MSDLEQSPLLLRIERLIDWCDPSALVFCIMFCILFCKGLRPPVGVAHLGLMPPSKILGGPLQASEVIPLSFRQPNFCPLELLDFDRGESESSRLFLSSNMMAGVPTFY